MGQVSWHIGIEGISHRQSAAIITDSLGNIRGFIPSFEPVSLHATPSDDLQWRLRALVRDVLRDASLDESVLNQTSICIGLMGTTFDYERQIALPEIFQKAQITSQRLVCTGDAEVIFASQNISNAGAVLLSSCGSTAYSTNGSQHFRVGGWGHAISDGGSGYWLGRETLASIADDYDHNETGGSQLWRYVQAFLNRADFVSDPLEEVCAHWELLRQVFVDCDFELREALFQLAHMVHRQGGAMTPSAEMWRAFVSGLSIPLNGAARAGDEIALNIVNAGAKMLARDLVRAITLAKPNHGDSTLVILSGGVLVNNLFYRARVIEKVNQIATDSQRIKFVVQTDSDVLPAFCGAVLLSLGATDKSCDRYQTHLLRPSSRIYDNLKSSAETKGILTWKPITNDEYYLSTIEGSASRESH